MRTYLRLSILAASVGVMVSCASNAGLKSMFSSKVNVRPYTVRELPNGLKVFFVKDDTLPRLSVQGLIKVGSLQEPNDLQGLNSLVAGLIDQGTTTRNAEKIADDFNALGTEFAVSPGTESTSFSASSLSTDADRLVELIADVLTNPTFSQKEISRAKDQALSALRRRLDSPAAVVGREYESFLFGSHPYGRDRLGSAKSIGRIDRTDLNRHYLSWYRPNNTVMAVAGRFDAAFENKFVAAFSNWTRRDQTLPQLPALVAEEKMTVRLVTKPALMQTQIRFGRLTVQRNHEDFLALRLAGEALGGSFASRLMAKIRNELGLTYSISSDQAGRKNAGSFTIATFTKNESVGKTVEEVLKVYRDFVNKGLSKEEVDLAKAQILGQYPQGLETADSTASQLLNLDFYGLPPSYLADYPSLIKAIDQSDVNAAIKKHFTADGLKILIYGDEKSVAPQLKVFSPEIMRLN